MITIAEALAAEGLDAGRHELEAVAAAPEHEPRVRPVVARAFASMRAAAASDGVRFVAVSGYRSVERQTELWDTKFQLALAQGASLDEALQKNLVYSAPPGWSRHHWGTELDLVDEAIQHEARLEPEDWQAGGACAASAAWLAAHAADFGFLMPYDAERGGYAVEPWHLSYAPAAIAYLARMARIDWQGHFRARPFAAAETIAKRCDHHFARLVLGVQPRLAVAVSR